MEMRNAKKRKTRDSQILKAGNQDTKQDYIDFSMKMKPYLRPRVNGVNKLWMFTEGFGSYLSDMGEHSLRMEEFPGTED